MSLRRRLVQEQYLSFPLTFDKEGVPQVSDRAAHVREQILQTLLTEARERVFRPEFGAGLRRLVFEPTSGALSEVTQDRLGVALADVLAGEVDPKTLTVNVRFEESELHVQVSYQIAAINQTARETFVISRWGEHG